MYIILECKFTKKSDRLADFRFNGLRCGCLDRFDQLFVSLKRRLTTRYLSGGEMTLSLHPFTLGGELYRLRKFLHT